MKQKSSLLNFAISLIALSPLAFLGYIFNALPPIVPVHYDLNFNPDKMDNKSSLWLVTGIVCLISIILYFLLINLHRIDPRRKKTGSSNSFKRIAIVVVVFMAVLNFLILLSVNNNIKLSQKPVFALLSLLIAFLGNYMNNLKPNYFAGLRLPWTLSSDYNWKKTHHFAGKLWFWGGLILVIFILVIPAVYSIQIFFALFSIMIIIPVIYSYRLFKQEKINTGY